ncbi:MAG: SPOR domain-containing protein [Janthinobacterium lividum]
MNLSDHLRPLLRDHDCVIIPDFGGLVAEYASARVQPARRHLLSPPTRQVAFNQALTRNDGLLLDALRQQLGVSAADAREQLRQAVAVLHQELQAQQRTELPGIGVFRQLAGRGLQFEYTGTDNLLTTAFGLPELTAHPVAVIDARLAREQQAQLVPRLRAVAQQRSRVPLRQLVRGGAIGLAAGVVAAAFYLLSLHPTAVPVAWQSYLPRWEQARPVPQQAALARPAFEGAATVAATVPAVVVSGVKVVTPRVATSPAVAAAQPVAAGAVVEVRPTLAARLGAAARPAASAVAALQPAISHLAMTSALNDLPLQSRVRVGSAVITTADGENVAKPIPAALRPPTPPLAKPGMFTTPPVARPLPPAPVHPVAAKVASARSVVVHKPSATPPVAKAKVLAPVAAPTPPATPKAVAPTATTTPAAAGAVPTTAIKARTGRYYIIVAAYSSLKRAEEGRRNLAHAGRPAKVIAPPMGSRLYRLSAADFADRPTALAAATHLRQNPHLDKGLTVFAY